MLLNDPQTPRTPQTTQAPSPWVMRWSHLAREGGSALDVACGSGRHMRWLAERGHAATGVDRSAEALRSAAAFGRTVLADIENGTWPFAGQLFDLVVVTNYLWRPRLPDIVSALAPGGVLLYETFAAGNETVGKPSRPDFLLQPGELLAACAGLRVIGYEDGYLDTPPRFVQRIAAVREAEPVARHRLES
ncbi:class I SAM-dependent methyltransferase [soil metagenome]